MQVLSPTPTLRGVAVLVEYDVAIREARAVHGAICRTTRAAESGHATMDQLVLAITELVAECGYTARLRGRTVLAIEFRVFQRVTVDFTEVHESGAVTRTIGLW
jgi:hypothetical protein